MTDLPFLDMDREGFSTRGPDVLAARAESWCARTPYGLAVLRHREAGMLLRDRRLRQGSYAWPRSQGLSGSFVEFWERSLIALEQDAHKVLRGVAMAALSEDFVLSLEGEFADAAEGLVEGLCGQGEIEFLQAFSEPFAGRAVTAVLGLPPEEAGWIAEDAAALGQAMTVGAKEHEAGFNAATDRLTALAERLLAGAGSAGRYADRLLAEAETNDVVDHQALVDLIVISIFGGVDTTRAQLAFALSLFASFPDQWAWLRQHSDKVPQAIEEVIRHRPTTTWSTREALESFEFQGLEITAGEDDPYLCSCNRYGPDPWGIGRI